MSEDEEWVDKIVKECRNCVSSRKMTEPEMFKAVAKRIISDAGKTLDEAAALWEIDPNSKELRDKFSLLEHYLSYLVRFCEGKV